MTILTAQPVSCRTATTADLPPDGSARDRCSRLGVVDARTPLLGPRQPFAATLCAFEPRRRIPGWSEVSFALLFASSRFLSDAALRARRQESPATKQPQATPSDSCRCQRDCADILRSRPIATGTSLPPSAPSLPLLCSCPHGAPTSASATPNAWAETPGTRAPSPPLPCRAGEHGKGVSVSRSSE